AVPDRSESAAEQLIDILDVQLGVQRVAEHEVMDPEGLAVIPGDLERKLAEHPQAQVVQYRHDVGQRQRTAEMIELAVQLGILAPFTLVETHRQRIVLAQPLQKLQVGHRGGGTETGAVTRGESAAE